MTYTSLRFGIAGEGRVDRAGALCQVNCIIPYLWAWWQWDLIVVAVLLWAIPLILLYVLGWALVWVRRSLRG